MTHNHGEIARIWAHNVATGDNRDIRTSRDTNVNPSGDVINSFGWWEMARIVRDRKGNPTHFLINGDIYSSRTSRQQALVRAGIDATGLPQLIVPYSVLDEAGIDRATVIPLDVTPATHTVTVHTRQENPGHWEYDYGTVFDDHGGWQNSLTGEIVLRSTDNWGSTNKPRTTCDHELPTIPDYPFGHKFEGGYDSPEYKAAAAAYSDANDARYTHTRLHHGEWEELPASTRQTGHKSIVSGPNGAFQWEMIADDDSPTGISYERTTTRHWLGESVIEAKVLYSTDDRCRECNATGQVEPYETMWADTPQTQCRLCRGRGRRAQGHSRTAKFLSGFDKNETRVSYFFCELPRMSETTVDAAYDALKPTTVLLAERMGREVKRQGDIFAVPMQTVTTRELRAMGATPAKAQYILGTNHRATEVATVRNGKGQLTYVRGTLTHAPEGRNPDHKRVTVGKNWHLVLKNTVPVAA